MLDSPQVLNPNGSNFWQKEPPLRVNCQKGPPSSKIVKKDHLRRGGKLHETTCGTCHHNMWRHILFTHQQATRGICRHHPWRHALFTAMGKQYVSPQLVAAGATCRLGELVVTGCGSRCHVSLGELAATTQVVFFINFT
jgi:hypothetical protein